MPKFSTLMEWKLKFPLKSSYLHLNSLIVVPPVTYITTVPPVTLFINEMTLQGEFSSS